MTHLLIATRILDVTTEISEPAAFVLGSIAPDSVHFRPGYRSSLKVVSHLCVGQGIWGRFTNNAEWTENVLRFLHENEHSEHIDFIRGYCAHILADIKNNIEIWTPYRLAHQEHLDRGLGSRMHIEAVEVDLAMYLNCPEKQELWEMLAQAEPVILPGLIERSDLEKARSHLLHVQYAGRKVPDMSGYQIVTVARMNKFVEEASEEIGKMLGRPARR